MLLSLIVASLIVMGSPGPSTISVTAVGAAFGLRRSLGHLAGLIAGTLVVLVAVVKHAGLPFVAVLTAELAQSYKPAPAVYQLAVDYLGYRPDEIMMVACHKYDLKAARAFGMRTAFVARPLEFGPGAKPDVAPERWFDVYADSFVSLADALGV